MTSTSAMTTHQRPVSTNSTTAGVKFMKLYPRSLNTQEIRDVLLEMTKECREGRCSEYENDRKLFDALDEVLSAAVVRMENMTKLNGLVKVVIQFLTVASRESEIILLRLRDDYGTLHHLGSLFDPEFNAEDVEVVLESIEIISRGLLVSWKAPYLRVLIKKVFILVLTKSRDSIAFEHGFQFLINVCRKNASCIMIARGDQGFKKVWVLLREILEKGQNPQSEILITHLLYLLEPTIPINDFVTGYEMILSWTEKTLTRWATGDKTIMKDLAKVILQTRQLMETILDKMKMIFESFNVEGAFHPANLGLSAEHVGSIVRAKDKVAEVVLTIMQKLQNSFKGEFKWSTGIVEELLTFMMILLPTYIPPLTMCDCYMVAFEIVDNIITRTSRKMKTFTSCLNVFYHLAEHLVEMESTKRKEFEPLLKTVLKRVELVPDCSQDNLENNVISVQFLSCLTSCHLLAEQVQSKLELTTLRKLLSSVSEEDTSPIKTRLKKSMLAVELLSIMSEFSKAPQMLNLLMGFISTPSTCAHISNCIQNGEERVIARALIITGSVGFSKKNLMGVAKALTVMREQPGCVNDVQPPAMQFSPGMTTGANKLTETLRSMDALVQANEGGHNPGEKICDMFTWFKLKNEMHEHETSNLNNHIYQLNKTISHLKCLLEKQSEFMSLRLATSEKTELEILSLQHQLDKASKESVSKAIELQVEVDQLKEALRIKSTGLKESNEALQRTEAECASLTAQLKEMTKIRDDLTKKLKSSKEECKKFKTDSNRLASELGGVKAKLSQVEQEVKEKEEERQQAHILLEKEKKMLDAIRGLVGDNFGNFGRD